MRSLAVLLVVLALATPQLALPQAYPRPVPRRAAAAVAPAPAPVVRPAPARAGPAYGYAPAPQPYATYAVSPFWYGSSWGWGYYPLFPRPAYVAAPYATPPTDPDRISTALTATGAAMPDGTAGGLALSVDGREVGFQVGVDAFRREGVTNDPVAGTSGNLGRATMHVTWSIAADDAYRVRLEAGASMISFPSAGAYAGTDYAGTVALGPDLGLSGHLGLLGPLGLEGHVRVTPLPVPAVDTRAAVALRAGPVAVTVGWRTLDVTPWKAGVPDLHFRGPELGLALRI